MAEVEEVVSEAQEADLDLTHIESKVTFEVSSQGFSSLKSLLMDSNPAK